MVRRVLPLLLLAGCAGSGGAGYIPDPTETAILRYDGTPVTLEDLRGNRPSALCVADTVARLEKELREPWQETRDARALLSALLSAHAADTRNAESAWANAEPPAPGNARALFGEYGLYAVPVSPYAMGRRVRPSTLNEFIELVLESHHDRDDHGLLRSAWRRFSPATVSRNDNYMAGYWLFELDQPGGLQVAISESLMGPHQRSQVPWPGAYSYRGPMGMHEGYECSEILIGLLAPMRNSPVQEIIELLHAFVNGQGQLSPGLLARGLKETPDTQDRAFLRAALAGLRRGIAEISWLPAATRRVAVCFSYLVDVGEARSTLGLTLERGQWMLDKFTYQPAGASLTGNAGASIDLMPLLRGLDGASGQ
ncbi:MAG: hypothetical protein KF696_03050 [Planctomycetes bacterium]|nr:hypothetical protein [Planctomycetota bacterium]MCW8134983.1 hypothetical protein [Planctomycetota bacterium]